MVSEDVWESIFGLCALLFLALVVFAGYWAADHGRQEVREEAVALGYAEYNATNGVWQWKTNLGLPQIGR